VKAKELIDSARNVCRMSCCEQDHGAIHLHARCHPGSRVHAAFYPETGKLRVECGHCREVVVEVGLTDTSEPAKPVPDYDWTEGQLPDEVRQELNRHGDALHALVRKYPNLRCAQLIACTSLGAAAGMCDAFGVDVVDMMEVLKKEHDGRTS
jgi:hypothetical protein